MPTVSHNGNPIIKMICSAKIHKKKLTYFFESKRQHDQMRARLATFAINIVDSRQPMLTPAVLYGTQLKRLPQSSMLHMGQISCPFLTSCVSR